MEFGTPVKLPDGRYYLKITGESVYFQLSKIDVQSLSRDLSIQLTEAQQEAIRKYEEEILAKAKASSQDWFGREVTPTAIDKAFYSSLTDGKFDVKMATAKGEVVTKVFGADKQPKAMDEVSGKVDLIVELSGVYFFKKSFGPIFRVIQVKESGSVSKKVPAEYMFQDDEDEEDPNDYLD
jgi:hypothetical protein